MIIKKPKVWFEYPKEYERYISTRSDCFLSGLLFVAMSNAEDIYVEGEVSPMLLGSLEQIQDYYHYWFPDKLNKIKINAKKVSPDKGNGYENVSSFSGGIDSFYTLYENFFNVRQEDKINSCLFISGFDSESKDKKNEEVIKNYEEFFSKYNIRLLKVKTNLKEYSDSHLNQAISFGVVLISTALSLSKLIGRFYVASAYQYNDVLPIKGANAIADGSNPITDILVSTESFKPIHHDSAISRIKKTKAVVKWTDTYNKFRVCWYPKGMNNCLKCSKCLRTIITLHILKKYHHFSKTFPRKFSYKYVRKWDIEKNKDYGFINEIIIYCKKNRKYRALFNIYYAKIRCFFILPYLLNPLYRKSYKLKNKYPKYKKMVFIIKKTLSID